MPEDAEAVPVKRGPGRPRKVAAPKAEAADDAWKTPDPLPRPAVAVDVDLDRIGLAVDPSMTAISFGDGSTYLCKNGQIVERVT